MQTLLFVIWIYGFVGHGHHHLEVLSLMMTQNTNTKQFKIATANCHAPSTLLSARESWASQSAPSTPLKQAAVLQHDL
jgi:hypothetical protein